MAEAARRIDSLCGDEKWKRRTGRPIVHVGEVVVGGGNVGNRFVSKLIDGVLRVIVLNHVS